VSVTSFRAARLPYIERATTNKRWRYLVIGAVPAGYTVVGGEKLRITVNGGTITTSAAGGAPSPAIGSSPVTLSYSGGTFTHQPGGSTGNHWLVGIWTISDKNCVGFRPIPRVSSTTAEDSTEFAPSGASGKPAFAVCIEVPNVRSSSTDFNCFALRMASVVIV
jgi:hypothetical protein